MNEKLIEKKEYLEKLAELSGEYEIFFPPPDFLTHLNYARFLNRFSKGLELDTSLSIKNKMKECSALRKKLNLIKLITGDLKGEYKSVLKYPAYAELCVCWIPIKSYYLMFNLLLVLDYLLSSDEQSFNLSHGKLHERFKDCIKTQKLFFNRKIFNVNISSFKIINRKVKSGANIKILNVNFNERLIQILKKLLNYKLEEFKRREKIKNFKTKRSKQKKLEFLKTNTINLFEFFYWYRIKANYRDLEFLNKSISSKQFSDFYCNYFELTFNFYKAFKELINNLSKARLGKTIL